MTKLLSSKGVFSFLSLCLFHFSFSQNNTCANAILLSSPTFCTTGTVVGSTADFTTACTGTVRYDVWYKFVATSNNPTIALSNIGSSFAGQTPRLQLFSFSNAGDPCGSLSSITCGGTALTGSRLTIGSTYYVRVYSITGSAIPTANGDFTICVSNPTPFQSSRMGEVFQQTTLSGTNLIEDPWEIIYGPDDSLWITEAKGYKVYKMDPVTGGRSTILDLGNSATGYLTSSEHTSYNRQFNIGTNNPQGGLAGMVLHPDWANKKYVYISYVHSYNNSAPNFAGVFYTNRIVRFTYNPTTGKLQSPISICDTLPGSSDHNSQRMIIAPVGGTDFLFYAAGDMGAGQFGNVARPIKAQFTGAYEGKILRFNLEEDADNNPTTPMDKWIPNTNPYNIASPAKQNAVWCIGIRNNQGFAYGNGKLYGSSHGPFSDDEINIFESGKNYGHPFVIGKADGNYNNSKAGNNYKTGSPTQTYNTIMPLITDEVGAAAGLSNYVDPMFTAYASTQGNINAIFTGAPDNTIPNGNWPSEGWSGMDIYSQTYIPGWKNSLMLGSLKWGRVLRFKLDETNVAIDSIGGHDTLSYFGSKNRFRDLAISPNGKDLFVIMDKSETTSGPSAANPRVSACNGCVQKYTFLGYFDNAGESSIPTSIPVTNGSTNNCRPGTTTTIDASNSSIWVPITGPDGNIIAEINANGQSLGVVQSSFYTSSTVRTTGGRQFLGRNIFLDPAVDPASNVSIRLYITKKELDALITAGGATGLTSLRILKNTDLCRTFPVATSTIISPVSKAHGDSGYVMQASVSLDAANSFYFATGNYVLPAQILTFKGSLENSTTQLKWSTKHDVKTSGFIVERSVDGNNYSQIADVTARQNSAVLENYTLADADVLQLDAKIVYYRLRLVEANGEWRYSNVVAIVTPNMNDIVSVSPNPADHIANVNIIPVSTGVVKWTLADNNGRQVMNGQVSVHKNKVYRYGINIQNLAKGIYYLQLSGASIDRKIKVQKL